MAQDRPRRSKTSSVNCSADKPTIKISRPSAKNSSNDSIHDNITTNIRTLRTASHPTTSFSAGSRVTHTAEILENILLRTIDSTIQSKKRLLVNQRVCKAFRDTICGWSVRLRRELCFPTPNIRWDRPSAGCNGLLIDRFSGLDLGDGTQIEVSVLCGTVRDRGLDKADLEVIFLRRRVRERKRSGLKTESWRRMKLRRDDHWVKVVVAKGMHQERKACGRQNPTLGELVRFLYPELSL
ncbi:hypothetical protein AC578_4728 [Pseudocercospora eumusae]|uniref:Uncharacterized protein n=1 Tax=Pseudocercospora eumusae TaxID=321146 RepID=A0A139GZ43_9PEZI|nr:hypothetical protein AC578_4728 [Pseudocercospora eumusae]